MADIEIYSSPLCGFCYSAKKLLSKKGVNFKEINVLTDSARKKEMINRAGGRHTVPQIFIDGKHIGGCDDLYALDKQGGLDQLLTASTGPAVSS
ncbi:MAG: glutaredoxin 3 [Rhodospirillaceae bacterium]|jgi:glutaredoxin 3